MFNDAMNMINNYIPKSNELSVDEKIELLDKNEGVEINLMTKELDNIFQDLFEEYDKIENATMSKYVIDEIEMFEDLEHNMDSGIYNKLNKTKTIFGDKVLRFMLNYPIVDVNELTERQNMIKNIVNSRDNLKSMSSILSHIKNYEKDIIWFWKEYDEHIISLFDMVYFKMFGLGFLNKNKQFLRLINSYSIIVAPAVAICSPFVYIIMPYISMRMMGIKMSIKDYLNITLSTTFNISSLNSSTLKMKFLAFISILIWIFFYGQSIYSSITMALSTHKVINILHKKLNIIYDFITNVEQLFNLLKLNNITIQLEIKDQFKELKSIFYNKMCYTCKPSLFSNKGEILGTFTEFTEKKDLLLNIIRYVGLIDAYHSIATLIICNDSNTGNNNTGNDSVDNNDNKYCFPTYITDSKTPVIKINNLWHPFASKTKAIANDINISENGDRNMLITGPNATGKSTYIKACAVAVFMAQTLGIAPGNTMEITPYKYIFTHVNIRDCKGKASLFEAEMNRCMEFFKSVKNIKETDFSFIIMDEILSSTNFEEGFSAAYAICSYISKMKTNTALITTHFTELSKLQKRTKKAITNYHFSISRDDENNIICSYKIKKGLSKDKIALELLKNKGFETEIIEGAINLCNNIKLKIKLPNNTV